MPIVIPKNELNEFSLPRVCVATGQAGPVTFQKVQFQFVPRWIAIFAVAPLLYLIFFMVLRKSASGTMPFSEQGWEEVKRARRNVMFSGLGLLAAVFLGVGAIASLKDVGLLVFFAVILGGVIALVATSMRVRKVFPFATFIDDQAVTLTLPSPQAEQLISRHLSAGARAP